MTTAQFPQAVRSGARSALVAQAASQLLALAVLAVLFRLVSQGDFGLLGMALPVVVLLRTFVSLGLAAAAVQHQGLTDGQLSALFWLHQVAGAASTLATLAAGPLLAWWYGAPALIGVCAALSGASLAATLGGQHLALLERKLLFGRIAAARLGSQAAGGAVAVGAALAGGGVWALVIQQYVELLALGAFAWGLEPWRPFWPGRAQHVPGLVRFGGFFSLSNLLTVAAFNADTVILSVMFGGTSSGRALIGMYSQAFNIMIKPVFVFTTPTSAIALPALSRAVDDRATYTVLVGAFFRLAGIVLFPCGVGLFLTARDVMLVLGGETWRDAGLLLEALAPAILTHGHIGLCTFVFTSARRTGRLFLAALLKLVLLVQGYAAGYYLGALYDPTPLGSALGVAYSHSLVTVGVLGVPYLLFCLYTVGVSPKAVLPLLIRPLYSALLMGLVVWGIRELLSGLDSIPSAVRLVTLISLGVGVYSLLARRELAWLLNQLRKGREER